MLQRKMTYVQATKRHISIDHGAINRQLFDNTSAEKKHHSVMMRPTLNSRGNFVKRSIIGASKQLEHTLSKKDTFKNEYN